MGSPPNPCPPWGRAASPCTLGQLGQHGQGQCPSHPPVPASKPRNFDYPLQDLISCISQLQSGRLDSCKSRNLSEAQTALQVLGKWLCSSPGVTVQVVSPTAEPGHAQGCRVMVWGQEGAPPLWEAAQSQPGGPEQWVVLRKVSQLWSQPWPEVGQGMWRDTEGHGGAHRTDRWLFSPSGTAPKDEHMQQGH